MELLFQKSDYIRYKHKNMKCQLKIIRKSDGKVFVKNFKTKKEMQRFQSNNYIIYTW